MLARQDEALRVQGASVMHLAVDNRLAGLLAVSDTVKATTADVPPHCARQACAS